MISRQPEHIRTRSTRYGVARAALRFAFSVCAVLEASVVHAVVPPLTNPNRNTDSIAVGAADISEVPAKLVNGRPAWSGTLLDVFMKPTDIWEGVHTFVYLPVGYTATAPAGTPGYDTIYLLHGAGGGAGDWSGDAGQVGQIVDASPFRGIVVMPEGGRSGWYTNWVAADLWNHHFNWQSFHVDHLRAWIDNHFRTNTNKSARSIAGLSMGGHGALSYAAQRPELYARAASFSGPGDIEDSSVQQLIIANEVTKFAGTLPLFGSAIYKDEQYDYSKRALDVTLVMGPYGAAWSRKNPYAQSRAYAGANGVSVALFAGNGGTSDAVASTLEYVAGLANDKMFARFKADGVQVRYCSGVGDHSWPYWREDFRNWLSYAYGTGTPITTCPNNWAPPRL